MGLRVPKPPQQKYTITCIIIIICLERLNYLRKYFFFLNAFRLPHHDYIIIQCVSTSYHVQVRLGDTKTPLIYSLVFTGLNAILDPLFIFTLNFGASGAAAGTALAQYIALIPLIYALHKRCNIDIVGRISELNQTLKEYVEAGSLVFLRTVGKVLAYSVCAREAALLGAVAAATYNLTFQLGFATTQICESIAVAVQTLLAREISIADSATKQQLPRRSYAVKHLIRYSIVTGGAIAFFLSLGTYLQQDKVLHSLTSSTAIATCAKGIFPAVLLTQGKVTSYYQVFVH